MNPASTSDLSSCTTFARRTLARLDYNDAHEHTISGLIRARQRSLAQHKYDLARIDSKLRKVEKRESQLKARTPSPEWSTHRLPPGKLYRRGISPFFSAEKPLYTIISGRKPVVTEVQPTTDQGIHSSHASIVAMSPAILSTETDGNRKPGQLDHKSKSQRRLSSEARKRIRMARFSEYLNEAIERKIDTIMQAKKSVHCEQTAAEFTSRATSTSAACIDDPDIPNLEGREPSSILPEVVEEAYEGGEIRPIVSDSIVPGSVQCCVASVQAEPDVLSRATQTRYSAFPARGLEKSQPLSVRGYKRSLSDKPGRSATTEVNTPGVMQTDSEISLAPLQRMPLARNNIKRKEIPLTSYTDKLAPYRLQDSPGASAVRQNQIGVVMRPSPLGQDSVEHLGEPTVIEVCRPKHNKTTRPTQQNSSISLGVRMEDCNVFDAKRTKGVSRIALKSKQDRGRLRLWLFGV